MRLPPAITGSVAQCGQDQVGQSKTRSPPDCENLAGSEYCEIGRSRRERRTVIGVSVVFDYDGDFDRSRVIEVAKNARKMFEGLPGLRFKFFTLDEKQQRALNIYVWDSREAAEAFFTDELRERVTGLYGVPPTVSYLEIAEFVDNS
jgi:heme-degrading monooxygenase HmoA